MKESGVTFAKFVEATLELGRRILKVKQFGVKTALESSPFGVDSNPIKDMIAVYSNTSNDSESVVIGYLNKNQLAQAGETRLFSLDSSGNLQSYLHLKNDGIIEINGNTNFTLKYNELQTVLNTLATNINTEHTAISTAIGLLGGSYVPTPITIDITTAKNETIKTN